MTGYSLVAVGHAGHGSLVATVLVIGQLELATNSRLALAGADRGANVAAAVVACSSRTARRRSLGQCVNYCADDFGKLGFSQFQLNIPFITGLASGPLGQHANAPLCIPHSKKFELISS